MINAIEGPGNAQYIDPRFACGKAPCFMIGGQDAWFLQTVIGKAANAGMLDRLKIALSLTSTEQGGLTSANAIATIPGQSAEADHRQRARRRLFPGRRRQRQRPGACWSASRDTSRSSRSRRTR